MQFFYKSWPSVYQRIFGIVFAVFMATLVSSIVALIQYPAPTYTWQQWQELQRIALPIHSFEVSGIPLVISGENYLLLERWAANPIVVNTDALTFYLFFFSVAMAVIMAYVTTLPRIWFFLGAGLIIFIISNLQLEVLGLMGFENKYPATAVIAIWVLICAYYQFFNRASGFIVRLGVMVIFLLTIAAFVKYTSSVVHPFTLLAAETLPVAMIALVLFIILAAHEIISGCLFLVGQGNRNPVTTKSSSSRSFFIISTLYLVTLWISYWNKIGWIDWSLPVNPVIFLMASSLIAIWGIRERAYSLFPSINEALTVTCFLALGIISIGLIGYFYSASLDIALLSLNDLIIYTHIGYGLMFIVYILSNFLGPLMQNLPVYKILYSPANMPYFSYILAGSIFTLGFIFYNRWQVPVNHFKSAYYTALGDVYSSDSDKLLAEGYYKKAHDYAPYNQHVATALAKLASEKGDWLKEEKYLKDANLYRPTAFTYVNSTLPLFNGGKNLEELLLLEEAHKDLPENGVLNNNLGLAYARLHLTDSASKYFAAASKDKLTRTSAEMNMLAVWAKQSLQLDADSISIRLESEHPNVMVNTLALANKNLRTLQTDIPWPADSILNIYSATLIGNYLTNRVANPDTALISASIRLARRPQNFSFKDIILVPAAYSCYASGQVSLAFQLLQQVIFDGTQQGLHNTTLALWSLELGKPDVALGSLQFAIDQHAPDAPWLAALSLAENGQLNESLAGWDSLQRKSKDSLVRSRAESMMRVLGGPESWYAELADNEKYLFTHYRINSQDSIHFNKLVDQIIDPHFKARAILSRSKKYFKQDDVVSSIKAYQKLLGLQLSETTLIDDIRTFELRLMAAQGQISALSESLNNTPLNNYQTTQRVYYESLRQWAAQDTLNAAKNLEWLANQNPYFDEGVVSAAAFFTQHGTDKRKPYRILSEALQMNPNSVRILKAYIPLAIQSGYDDYASSSMETLRRLIAPTAMEAYLRSLAR